MLSRESGSAATISVIVQGRVVLAVLHRIRIVNRLIHRADMFFFLVSQGRL
jgi:hypothetical protein